MRAFIILCFFASLFSFGQDKSLEDIKVGFVCGIDAEMNTSLVKKMTDLVIKEKYSEISSYLYSQNSGEIFLTILILERLAEKKIYFLKEEELKLINILKSSSIPVYNCFGCLSEMDSLNELFKKENSIGEITWLNKILPID